MRVRSLQRRIALIILGVGLLAIVIDSGLIGSLLTKSLMGSSGSDLAQRTRAVAACCLARSPSALLGLTERAALTGQAGTPTRFALVVGTGNASVYAPPRWVPSRVRAVLLAALAHHVLKSPGQWTVVSGMLVAQAPITFAGRPAGALILAVQMQEIYRARGALLVLIVWSALVGLVVAALAGLFAARAVTRPIRAIAAVARSIAAGHYNQRATPRGPEETVDLARAFNAMLDEVARQRRMERDLLANVSHELAAPLGIIRGYAEALADGVLDSQAHRETALRAIIAESTRLGGLIGDLLDLALLESGQARIAAGPMRPGDLLLDVTDRVSPAAGAAAVTLLVDAPPDLPVLSTDSARLEGVLVNLITNALDHTPAGGRITLAARAEPGRLALSVRDTGEGIAPADLPRIFERFYRGDKSRDRRAGAAGGIGLGLAICRQVVDALGGTIDVASAPGEGSTFTVRLPLPAAPSRAETAVGPAHGVPLGSRSA